MHYSVILKVLGIMRGINCVANVVVKFKSGYFEQSYRKNRIFHAEISYRGVGIMLLILFLEKQQHNSNLQRNYEK